MEKKNLENTPLPVWFRTCEFNPRRDISEVEQGLAVDIDDALRTGIVKDMSYALDYNGLSEPGQIIGRISDNFDAIEAQRVVRKFGKRTNTESVSTAGASSAPAAAQGSESSSSE